LLSRLYGAENVALRIYYKANFPFFITNIEYITYVLPDVHIDNSLVIQYNFAKIGPSGQVETRLLFACLTFFHTDNTVAEQLKDEQYNNIGE